MKKLYLGLFAISCLAGGWGLTATATAQSYPACDSLVGKRCTGGYTRCTSAEGTTEWLQCFNGTWHWA